MNDLVGYQLFNGMIVCVDCDYEPPTTDKYIRDWHADLDLKTCIHCGLSLNEVVPMEGM